MPYFDLQDSGAKSFDIENVRYLAKKGGGIVNVENPRHAAMIRENTGLKEWNAYGLSIHGGGDNGIVCGGCGFRQWSFLAASACPRCDVRDWRPGE